MDKIIDNIFSDKQELNKFLHYLYLTNKLAKVYRDLGCADEEQKLCYFIKYNALLFLCKHGIKPDGYHEFKYKDNSINNYRACFYIDNYCYHSEPVSKYIVLNGNKIEKTEDEIKKDFENMLNIALPSDFKILKTIDHVISSKMDNHVKKKENINEKECLFYLAKWVFQPDSCVMEDIKKIRSVNDIKKKMEFARNNAEQEFLNILETI